VEDRRKVFVSLAPPGEELLAALSVGNLRELQLVAPIFAGLLRQMDTLETG
jgi:hypothetical protein